VKRALLPSVVAVVVATAVIVGGQAVLGNDKPTSEPTRDQLPKETPRPPTTGDDELIPLDKPIPFPIPLTVGDRTVIMPTGSVLEDVQSDPGGETLTISRGESKVVLDGETGDILEWDVAERDSIDFESIGYK
jgi:hypothetical protein